MGKKLTVEQRVTLREAAYLHSNPQIRGRSLWILWADRQVPIARIARAARVSRPTIYRYLGLWERFGTVDVLATRLASRIAPWKRSGQGRRGER